jgi:drug/metabolite transporter (DMT)-like permease
MTGNEEAEAQAKARFAALSALRMVGVLLVMAGLAMAAGRWQPIGGETDKMIGIALVLIGAFDFAVLPLLLARRWKSQGRV